MMSFIIRVELLGSKLSVESSTRLKSVNNYLLYIGMDSLITMNIYLLLVVIAPIATITPFIFVFVVLVLSFCFSVQWLQTQPLMWVGLKNKKIKNKIK